MIEGAHILYDGFHAWCGATNSRKTTIFDDEAFFGTDRAALRLKAGMPEKPCPDCAREIIRQLLKAIE